jgi:hypothetical protein
MIISKQIKINVTNRTKGHYEKLGYQSKDGTFEIDYKDLPKSSAIKIHVKCDVCGFEKKIPYYKYLKNIDNGGYYACSTKCGINKMKETNIKKYGCECSLNNNEVNEKRLQTWKRNYGVDNPNKSDIIRNKIEKTSLEKYGFKTSLLNDNVNKKIKNTLLKNYGVDNPNKSKIIRDKIENTNLKKYGYITPLLNNDIKEKTKKTNLIKYGHVNPNSSEMIKKKKEIKYREIMKDKLILFYEKINITIIDIDFSSKNYYIKCSKCGKIYKIPFLLLQNRRYTNTILCTICHPINSRNKSGVELQLLNFIRKNYDGKIIENSRKIINPYELDSYLPDLNLAFEFNGVYWHNELHKDINYHKMKSDLCEEKGIQLIHIWEDDWLYKQEIIKSIILDKLNIYSNEIDIDNCTIKEINDIEIVEDFLNENHIQGFINSDINIALYSGSEMVSLMSFTENDNEIEVVRFCNKIGYNISKSIDKLFRYFLDNYPYNSITIYVDRTYSNGNDWNNLGFKKIDITDPICSYVDKNIRINSIDLSEKNIHKTYNSGLLLLKF